MICTIVLLIPDPVGTKNTEDTSKASSLALSALQELTDSTKGVSSSIIEGTDNVYIFCMACAFSLHLNALR